jgi:hypothetical protein
MQKKDLNNKTNFLEFLKNGQWAIVTGDNPNGELTPEHVNEVQKYKAWQWLLDRGYSATECIGFYNNMLESSYFVYGMTYADAIDFAVEFNQECVATNMGMVYKDGKYNPYIDALPCDDTYSGFTEIIVGDDSFRFYVQYDWSKTKPAVIVRNKITAIAVIDGQGEKSGTLLASAWSLVIRSMKRTDDWDDLPFFKTTARAMIQTGIFDNNGRLTAMGGDFFGI